MNCTVHYSPKDISWGVDKQMDESRDSFVIYITGPVGSIIYADLYGSMKIKFGVLIQNTDQ